MTEEKKREQLSFIVGMIYGVILEGLIILLKTLMGLFD